MNSNHPCLVVSLLVFTGVFTGHAQTSIGWFKIAGGGGTSTGGVHAASGAIGQHDAGGPLTNAQYTVRSGFWVLPQAVPTPGAPTLAIVPAASGQATVSWSPATPGFILQEALNPASSAWTNAPSGAANPVTVPAVAPAKFYRLIRP